MRGFKICKECGEVTPTSRMFTENIPRYHEFGLGYSWVEKRSSGICKMCVGKAKRQAATFASVDLLNKHKKGK